MAILDILEFPDPQLRTIARPVKEVDARIQQLISDMTETMYEAEGIGLAATQVNVHRQVVVIDVSEERDTPLVLLKEADTEKTIYFYFQRVCDSSTEPDSK